MGPTPLGTQSTTTAGAGAGAQADSAHPLEARLKAWQATQEALRMETLRRTFGMGSRSGAVWS